MNGGAAQLQEEIRAEIAGIRACVSVLARDLSQREPVVSILPEREFVSASLIKTPVLLAALDLVRRGELGLDRPVPVPAEEILPDSLVFDRGEETVPLRELLTWMIIDSDNTAANVLIRLIGMDAVNAYCASLGLRQTCLRRRMLDFSAARAGRENRTSAADQFALFSALYRGEILTPELCAFALGVLKRQRDFGKALRYLCPRDAVFAHKTGGLDFLRHDAGIFYLPGRDYFFGCFVWDAREDSEQNPVASRLIGRISERVYHFFRE